jgi:hypothetical protein
VGRGFNRDIRFQPSGHDFSRANAVEEKGFSPSIRPSQRSPSRPPNKKDHPSATQQNKNDRPKRREIQLSKVRKRIPRRIPRVEINRHLPPNFQDLIANEKQ